jgi:hypothetical protein
MQLTHDRMIQNHTCRHQEFANLTSIADGDKYRVFCRAILRSMARHQARPHKWRQTMKTMFLAALAAMALGASTVAYAGEGEGGQTAGALEWRAQNGDAAVPATKWFAATPTQRQMLSRQYQGDTFPGGNSSVG